MLSDSSNYDKDTNSYLLVTLKCYKPILIIVVIAIYTTPINTKTFPITFAIKCKHFNVLYSSFYCLHFCAPALWSYLAHKIE